MEFASLAEKISKEMELNSGNIILVTIKLMESVELYKNLSGDDKKKLVMEQLNKMIESSTNNELKKMMESHVPSIIDNIALASKGLLNINKISPLCGLVSACC